MSNELIINASLPETRIALMENGEIQELLIERASGKGIVGNIYKGRVTRVLPGMQAAFVDIGLEKAAFLYVDDVFVHPKVWEEEEGPRRPTPILSGPIDDESESKPEPKETASSSNHAEDAKRGDAKSETKNETEKSVILPQGQGEDSPSRQSTETASVEGVQESDSSQKAQEQMTRLEDEVSEMEGSDEEDSDDDDDSRQPVGMGPDDSDEDSGNKKISESSGKSAGKVKGHLHLDDELDRSLNGNRDVGNRNVEEQPAGTVAPESSAAQENPSVQESDSPDEEAQAGGPASGRKRHRRGRRGGRFRRRGPGTENAVGPAEVQKASGNPDQYPETYHEQVADAGASDSDRSSLLSEDAASTAGAQDNSILGRPEVEPSSKENVIRSQTSVDRSEFKAPRSRDRRIRQKTTVRPVKSQVNIQDLLKEGQEVLVQVAKDPIATKGARLTCHISLPGRHLVCMPTIDHVGVSRRIEREDERRRLREYVERNRPRNLGFIVRTASGKQQSEKRIKQDIEYLTRLWTEIKEKAGSVSAPSLVYEDLNSILRAIRDWVNEDIDKVIVDSRHHFNDIQRFVSHFMPALKQKVELYHGDIPIFDAYGISTELSRALERKVWLKSGGYIVVDQAEALVAIDVNTGRYVGKKNLEDTILKTNLEAVQEIAYQLRLRNCGGIIILDLIDMEKDENKQRVYRALEDALSKDRARPTILKISELGLVEMTRKRTRDTIVRTLCESCSHCEGKGFIKGKQTVAYEVMREVERAGIDRDVGKILVQAHPDVIDILAIDERETLDQVERRYRKQIYLQAVTEFHPEQFEVTADKRERSDRGRDQDREHRNERSHDSNHERPRHRDRDRDRNRQETHLPSPIPAPLPTPLAEGSTSVPPVAKLGIVVDSSLASGSEPGNGVEKGNALSPVVPVSAHSANGNATPAAASGSAASQDGFYDEEDRLAFLRAQAAQDAALARLGSGSGHAVRNTGDMRGNDRGTGGGSGRRPVRGRRGGGKFRRGADRPRSGNGPGVSGSGPKPYGFSNRRPESGGNTLSKDSSPGTSEPSGNTGESSGSEGSSGGTGGSGGDHSRLPF